MVEVAVRILNVPEAQLLNELKVVHQRYHNSEQPFALLEAPTVEHRYPTLSPLERKHILDEAFQAFNAERKASLRPFPGVAETLHRIRANGCIIVAYTEAVLENSLYRLIMLNLIDDINLLYAPLSRANGHPDPARQGTFDPFMHKVRLLPGDHRKPDPGVLRDICYQQNVSIEDAIYVGDSLTRDIGMASRANMTSVWCRYGCSYDPSYWEKLVRITHWTDDDVAREKRLRDEFKDIHPDYEIDSFSELSEIFDFRSTSLLTA